MPDTAPVAFEPEKLDRKSKKKSLQWKEVPKKGEIYPPRFAHTATVLGGFVYVFGGDTGFFYTSVKFLNDLYVYKPETQKWTHLKPDVNDPIPEPRCGHTTVAYDGKLILFGGNGRSGSVERPFNDVWEYEPLTNKWTQIETQGTIPTGRFHHTSVVYKDEMYVVGGQKGDKDVWRLDLKKREWHKQTRNEEIDFNEAGSPPSARWMHTATVWGDHMYIFGGEHETGKATSELWKFNFLTSRWHLLRPADTGEPPAARSQHAAVHAKGKWIIHAGRNDQYGKLGDAYEFDFKTEKWGVVTTLPAPFCNCGRWGHEIVFLGKEKAFLVTGGATIEVLVLL